MIKLMLARTCIALMLLIIGSLLSPIHGLEMLLPVSCTLVSGILVGWNIGAALNGNR